MSFIAAADLAESYAKVAGTRSNFILWRCSGGDQLVLTGSGPQFNAIAELTLDEYGPEMICAVPTGLSSAWLKGTEGTIEMDWRPDESMLVLSTARSSIELEVATDGEEFLRLLNIDAPTGKLTKLGFGPDLWEAMADVAWASSIGVASNVDRRKDAVHISYGKVWAFSEGRFAQVEVDLPPGVFPMIPSELAAMGKIISDLAMVSVDDANRLHILDAGVEFIAPLIGGEPFPDLAANPNLIAAVTGPETRIPAKSFEDAVARLDRFDADADAQRANLGGRVQVRTIDSTTLGLSVLVGKRKATEAVEYDGSPINCIFAMPSLRAFLGFTGMDELTITRHPDSTSGPFHIRAANRGAWLMGLGAKSL